MTPRNPYIIGKSSPQLQLSVVAFIDILGYSDLVKESMKSGTSNELLKKLHKVLRAARKHVDPKPINCINRKFKMKDFLSFRAFTDNIVIGYPISGRGDGEAELVSIFNNLSFFEMVMTMNGFFVRGAIAVGDLYMDDIAVFGPGLIEAYEAEHSSARDPRIILTEPAKKAVDQHLKYYGSPTYSPHASYLLKDIDGQYFVNYLDSIIREGVYFFKEGLQQHKESIETELKKYFSQPTKWSKYLWVANYHNYFCKSHSELDTCYQINLENYRMTPALIID